MQLRKCGVRRLMGHSFLWGGRKATRTQVIVSVSSLSQVDGMSKSNRQKTKGNWPPRSTAHLLLTFVSGSITRVAVIRPLLFLIREDTPAPSSPRTYSLPDITSTRSVSTKAQREYRREWFIHLKSLQDDGNTKERSEKLWQHTLLWFQLLIFCLHVLLMSSFELPWRYRLPNTPASILDAEK